MQPILSFPYLIAQSKKEHHNPFMSRRVSTTAQATKDVLAIFSEVGGLIPIVGLDKIAKGVLLVWDAVEVLIYLVTQFYCPPKSQFAENQNQQSSITTVGRTHNNVSNHSKGSDKNMLSGRRIETRRHYPWLE
jgi:hypothetical protein